jgi:hypothetical protein
MNVLTYVYREVCPFVWEYCRHHPPVLLAILVITASHTTMCMDDSCW